MVKKNDVWMVKGENGTLRPAFGGEMGGNPETDAQQAAREQYLRETVDNFLEMGKTVLL